MSDLYQNYVVRKPSQFGERLVRDWHRRLADRFETLTSIRFSAASCIEIGPGHGYFAELLVSRGCDYSFLDISSPVVNNMLEKGFRLAEPGRQPVDVIWLSHVLEHSTDWKAARNLLSDCLMFARTGGKVVVIGPDYLSWGKWFFDIDATHGYPTTLRTVAQLMKDVGMDVTCAKYHRGGRFALLPRTLFGLAALIPNALGRFILARGKMKSDDHQLYSWKAVLGWRQVFVIGSVRTID